MWSCVLRRPPSHMHSGAPHWSVQSLRTSAKKGSQNTGVDEANQHKCAATYHLSPVLFSLVSEKSCRLVLCHAASGRDRPLIPRSLEAIDEHGRRAHGPQAATYVAVAFNWDGRAITLAKMREPLDSRWLRTFA